MEWTPPHNLLPKEDEQPVVALPTPQPPRAPHRRGMWVAAIAACAVFFLTAAIARSVPQEEGATGFTQPVFTSLRRLVHAGTRQPEGAEDDRINILLLGIGGEGHDGPELTDTIILGSVRPSDHQLGLLSLPRDLLVNAPEIGRRKINAVNALAQQRNPGEGMLATAEVVEDIVGQEIPHVVTVNFRGFAELIDALGGIDIMVDRTFTDPLYPLDDGLGSVEELTFTQGWTHMDGKTALQFVRSRHGNNGEGTDFARAARQQKVILAAKDKALALGTLLNPRRLSAIMDVLGRNVRTNISTWQLPQFAKEVAAIATDQITTHVLTNGNGVLYDANVDGAYVLLPYHDDWRDVRAIAAGIFSQTPATRTLTLAAPEEIRLALRNGTSTSGLAARAAQLFTGTGFTVVDVGNATAPTFERTVIIDNSQGRHAQELHALRTYLDADVQMSGSTFLAGSVTPDALIPELDAATAGTDADFIIIFGTDAQALVGA